MKVVLDATGLGSGLGGDETMLRGVIAGLAATAQPDDDMIFLLREDVKEPDEIQSTAGLVSHRLRRMPGLLHYSLGLPRALRELQPDVVFSVTHGPLVSSTSQVLMVQDLSFLHVPDMYPWSSRLRLNRLVQHQARRSAVVTTVSEFSRHDIIESYGIAAERVVHVPNVIQSAPPFTSLDAADGQAFLASHGITGPFALFLGNIHPRKNLRRTIDAFLAADAPDHRLVIAGAQWWGDEFTDTGPDSERVVFLGRVSDAEREYLLRLADVLLYVSLFEGFGLPPLEAMARGTPSIVSDVTSLPEVVGHAAMQVDPLEVGAIRAAIEQVLGDGVLRQELVRRGHEQVATFSAVRNGTALRKALAQAANVRVVSASRSEIAVR